ncbi:MAG TPA: carotenoid biosynthesis protein [Methylomirabilota bacterium]|nr:carotenoid biosynthesis protein [Methylomirabilota bacterium]
MDLLLGTLVLRPYVFAFLVSYLVAGVIDLGWRRTLLFGAWVWPVAWLAEFSSTRTGVPFGLYVYTGTTRGQELFIANVPFMDALSFTFLAYSAFCLARVTLGRQGSPLAVTVLGGVLMMLLDVVIDPAAVRGERWFLGHIFYYPEGGVYFGVPLSNFAGWMLVGMTGIGGFLYWTGDRSVPGEKPLGGIALYYAVLGFNLAVTAWIGEWVLLACGAALHVTVAALLWIARRRPVGWADMESQKA